MKVAAKCSLLPRNGPYWERKTQGWAGERRAEYSVKVPQCKGNYFFFTSQRAQQFMVNNKILLYLVFYFSLHNTSVRWDSLLYICSSSLHQVASISELSQAPCLLVISVLFSLFYKKRTEITSLEVKQPGKVKHNISLIQNPQFWHLLRLPLLKDRKNLV